MMQARFKKHHPVSSAALSRARDCNLLLGTAPKKSEHLVLYHMANRGLLYSLQQQDHDRTSCSGIKIRGNLNK